MAYVQQICDGFNKKSLMGNWFEQRLYPEQPFRTQPHKQARQKDQGITCFDNTGFQRALPRLSRRNKWETTSRIILDDGIKQQNAVMKQQFPNGQQQHSVKQMTRPIDKNSVSIKSTTVHPHSQIKANQKKYLILDEKTATQLKNQRDVLNYGSDFKSTLIQHPKIQKFVNYESTYKGNFNANEKNRKNRTVSQFNKTQKQAGNFNQVPQEQVKPITTMTGQLKKQVGDSKQVTQIQRSWVPPRDKALSYSMGKSANDFKYANIPKNDIQTSINMNIGVHNVHPKNVADNYFRHIRQDVTIIQNNTFCSRP